MTNKVYSFIKKLTNARNIWVFALIASGLTLIMLVLNIPDNLAAWMGYSGQLHMFAPDSAAFSSPGTAYNMLGVYGEEGRKAYFYNSLLFDIAYPSSYTLLLATGFTALLNRLLPSNSPWQKLGLLTLFAGLFDLLENLSVYFMIANYPTRLEWLNNLTAYLTSIKGLTAYGSFLLLLLGLAIMLLKKKKTHPLAEAKPS